MTNHWQYRWCGQCDDANQTLHRLYTCAIYKQDFLHGLCIVCRNLRLIRVRRMLGYCPRLLYGQVYCVYHGGDQGLLGIRHVLSKIELLEENRWRYIAYSYEYEDKRRDVDSCMKIAISVSSCFSCLGSCVSLRPYSLIMISSFPLDEIQTFSEERNLHRALFSLESAHINFAYSALFNKITDCVKIISCR